MSYWQEHNLAEKVAAILGDVPEYAPGHHLGRPFLTAYMIAVEFERRFPEDVSGLNLQVGAAGSEKKNTLAPYLARELSEDIEHKGNASLFEGGFLSGQNLRDLPFTAAGQIVHPTGSEPVTISVFRLHAE